jgi:fatty acid desaturase
VLTLIPYDYWSGGPKPSTTTAGNLDRRGLGDVNTLTVEEYRALPRWRRIAYRLSRSQLVLLGLGPIHLFVLKYRLPVGLMRDGKGVWISAMAPNLGIHHVHHLASRIPSYRLREVLADHPELRDVGRLTLRQSLRCFRLALWDEESGRLVAFRDLRMLVERERK